MTLTEAPVAEGVDSTPNRPRPHRIGLIAAVLGVAALVAVAAFLVLRSDDGIEPQLTIETEGFITDGFWSPEGAELGVLDERGFSVFDGSTGVERGRIDLTDFDLPQSGVWTDDDRLFLVVGSQLMAYDTRTLEPIETIDLGVAGEPAELIGATVSNDGAFVAYVDTQSEENVRDLVVVDTASAEERRYDVPFGAIRFAFDDTGRQIGYVTGCDIECVSGVLDLDTGEVVSTRTSEGDTGTTSSIEYVRGAWYAGVHGGLVVHDLGAVDAPLVGWSGVTRSVAVDPQNRLVVSGDGDFGLEFRSLDSGELLGTADLGDHNPAVSQWSSDGGRVLVAAIQSVEIFEFS